MEWTVVHEDSSRVLVSLDQLQYKNLIYNLTEILRWTEQAAWRLGYYRGR